MGYSQVTREVISFIEENLLDRLELDQFPGIAGYSKYHLSRIFKHETGKTIGEYIRHRRLAVGAGLLKDTVETVMSIAFLLQFQSQEAFARAFKERYVYPPGQYRRMVKLITLEREWSDMEQSDIKGWMLSGNNPDMYRVKMDDRVFHMGTASAFLYSVDATDNSQFATLMQEFQSTLYEGKRVRLSGYIKTEKAAKCGIWMRIDNVYGDPVQFDNMDDRPITGTNDWNYHSIVLDVPKESASIHFGVLLIGEGNVWMDGFRFEEVDSKEPSTNTIGKRDLPQQPRNLDFGE